MMESRSSTVAASRVPLDVLLRALGEGVYGVDREGRASFLNPSACRLLGYEADELLGERQHDRIHRPPSGAGPEADECPIYAVLRDGLTRHITNELFFRKDGHPFPVEYTATPIREGEEVVGAVVVFRDVGERVRAEAELRQAYDRQHALLENLPDAAWLKDADGRYVAVNARFEKGTMVPRETLLGNTMHAFMDRGLAERYEALDRLVLETGEASTVEEQLSWGHPSLAGRWIETERIPIPGPEGRAVGLVGLARDITARKRAAEAHRFLAEAGQVLVAAQDWMDTVSGVGALVVPRMGDWCILTIFHEGTDLPTVSGFAGRADDEARLKALLARHPRGYAAGSYLIGRVVLEGRGERILQPSRLDLEALAGDPTDVEQVLALQPASLLVIPLQAHSSTIGALVLVRRAGRPPFEEPDLLLVEEVARRAALAIEASHQHKAAREAAAARDVMLRLVAHDLRGLVNTVSLSARMIDASRLDGRNCRALHRIEQVTQQMERLIEDLTDADQQVGNATPLDLTDVAPDALLHDAVDAAEPLALERGVTLVVKPSTGAAPVRGDRHRLLRVLANLVQNAIQHSQARGVVTLKAEPLGREVLFSVEDTGRGISEEELPHVFDRFWRARDAPRGGSGLGLPIARSIVASHGGRIWCHSELGRGARFCFTLPGEDTSPGRDGHDTHPAVTSTSGEPAGGDSLRGEDPRVRILLVDDHPVIRDGIRSILAAAGWIEVIGEASTGNEAVEVARLLDPDVVVIDLSLPGIDGYEAMRRIGAFSRRTRLLVLTAHAPEKSLVKCMESGAYGFVRKANAHEDLVPAVKRVVRGEVFLDAKSNHVLMRTLERTLEARRRLAGLTPQEREIIRLTAAGYNAQEAGAKLFLSPHTVASYRSRAMRKLGLERRSDLVHFALETSLISAD